MRQIVIWIHQKDTLIPANLIPGSIADAIYPRQDRSQAVESQSAADSAADSDAFLASFPRGMDAIANQSDEFAVKRLEEERAQAKKMREKFPNLRSDYCFSESEAASYLSTLNLELVVRRYRSPCYPEGRWLGRQFIDSYVSNGAARARTFPAEVSGERCLELANQSQLYAYHWIELTGVGIGHHGPYSVSEKGVFFEKWSNEQIQGADLDWQEEMLLDNQTASNLVFPCSPADLTGFVKNAIGLHQFSLPDSFVGSLSYGGMSTEPPPVLSSSCETQPVKEIVRTERKTKALVDELSPIWPDIKECLSEASRSKSRLKDAHIRHSYWCLEEAVRIGFVTGKITKKNAERFVKCNDEESELAIILRQMLLL